MRVGDILEWFAGAALTASAYCATHLAWPSLLVAGVVLAYEAQCYSGHPVPYIPHPSLRIVRRLFARLRKGAA